MRKKICFCTYDAPLFQSVNSWLRRLLPALEQHNFSIEVLVFYEGDLEDCQTYNFCVISGYKVKAFPFKTIAEKKIRWILETMASDLPDIFVSNMLVHASYAAASLKKVGVHTIGVVHSDETFYKGFVEVFVNGPKEFRFTSVVAVSQYLYKAINATKPSEVISACIPCGVPVKGVPITSFKTSVLKMIYIGRLSEKQKRISLVVKAMCDAANKIDGVEGIIYGHGEETRVLELIKKYSLNNQVKFGGPLLNSEVYETLSRSQIFVLLSDYEGLPQSLLEAMACGLVPVCSDIKSGIPELISDHKTGILVHNRHSEFTAAIQKLKYDSALCEHISQNAREKVIEYSLEACTNAWVTHLNELLSMNTGNKKTLQMPLSFDLPKPHRYFKMEDFRHPTLSDKIMNLVRKTWMFYFIKKLVFGR